MMHYLSAWERFQAARRAHLKAPSRPVFNGCNVPILPTDEELDELFSDEPLSAGNQDDAE